MSDYETRNAALKKWQRLTKKQREAAITYLICANERLAEDALKFGKQY